MLTKYLPMLLLSMIHLSLRIITKYIVYNFIVMSNGGMILLAQENIFNLLKVLGEQDIHRFQKCYGDYLLFGIIEFSINLLSNKDKPAKLVLQKIQETLTQAEFDLVEL